MATIFITIDSKISHVLHMRLTNSSVVVCIAIIGKLTQNLGKGSILRESNHGDDANLRRCQEISSEHSLCTSSINHGSNSLIHTKSYLPTSHHLEPGIPYPCSLHISIMHKSYFRIAQRKIMQEIALRTAT